MSRVEVREGALGGNVAEILNLRIAATNRVVVNRF
jgi:hypothetical protein